MAMKTDEKKLAELERQIEELRQQIRCARFDQLPENVRRAMRGLGMDPGSTGTVTRRICSGIFTAK